MYIDVDDHRFYIFLSVVLFSYIPFIKILYVVSKGPVIVKFVQTSYPMIELQDVFNLRIINH
jgi:hypothetical protein